MCKFANNFNPAVLVNNLKPHCVSRTPFTQNNQTNVWKPYIRNVLNIERLNKKIFHKIKQIPKHSVNLHVFTFTLKRPNVGYFYIFPNACFDSWNFFRVKFSAEVFDFVIKKKFTQKSAKSFSKNVCTGPNMLRIHNIHTQPFQCQEFYFCNWILFQVPSRPTNNYFIGLRIMIVRI